MKKMMSTHFTFKLMGRQKCHFSTHRGDPPLHNEVKVVVVVKEVAVAAWRPVQLSSVVKLCRRRGPGMSACDRKLRQRLVLVMVAGVTASAVSSSPVKV